MVVISNFVVSTVALLCQHAIAIHLRRVTESATKIQLPGLLNCSMDAPVIGMEEHVFGVTLINVTHAETEVAQETMRVGTGKRLAVGRPLTVEHRAVTLTLYLQQHVTRDKQSLRL